MILSRKLFQLNGIKKKERLKIQMIYITIIEIVQIKQYQIKEKEKR